MKEHLFSRRVSCAHIFCSQGQVNLLTFIARLKTTTDTPPPSLHPPPKNKTAREKNKNQKTSIHKNMKKPGGKKGKAEKLKHLNVLCQCSQAETAN